MRCKELQITLTSAEASELMALKEILNRDGARRSTSQTVAHAIRTAKAMAQTDANASLHDREAQFSSFDSTI